MSNIDVIKQEIKEHLEKQLLYAYALGESEFDEFVSGLSEEQKDLLPGLNNLLEGRGGMGPAAKGMPVLAGKGPAPVAPSTSMFNKNPLRGAGGFAGFGGFPNTTPTSRMGSTNATAKPVQGQAGSPSGPSVARSRPPTSTASSVGPSSTISSTQAPAPIPAAAAATNAMASGKMSTTMPKPQSNSPINPIPAAAPAQAAATSVKMNSDIRSKTQKSPVAPQQKRPLPAVAKPIQTTQNRPNVAKPPVRPAQKAAKPPMRPAQKSAKSTFRNTNTSNMGSHMSRSMGGLGEETNLKESFESFLRNKFLKGE